MSEHDPLCPYAHVSGPSCEICDLIRQAEKRGRQGDWWVRGHKAGYEQGQQDALARAVQRYRHSCLYRDMDVDPAVIAAIKGGNE